MTIETDVLSMRARMPWTIGQKILSFLDLPRGHGWDKTLLKISTADSIDQATGQNLRGLLVDHYHCGEKLVRFFAVEPDIGQRIADAIATAEIPSSVFRSSYPALLHGEDLVGAPTRPTLIDVTSDENGTTATFGSIRVLSVREELEPDELPEEAAEALRGFDELVGIRHVRWQAMDIVKVSNDNTRIEFRVDFPKGMHASAGDFAHVQLRQELAGLAGADMLSEPINLFPLIDRIYKAEGEGVVVELAFGTTTASLKHEKMRRRRLCLRQEAYHRGGKQALASEIEIHRLSVIWPLRFGRGFSQPELTLSASARSAGSATPILPSAVIRYCADHSDFEYVRDRMLHYLAVEG